MQQLKLGWAAHNQELPEGDFSRLLGTVYIFLKITKEKRKKQPELCFTEHECKIPFNSWGQEALGCGSLLSGALTSLWWRTHQKPIRRLTTIRREQAEPQAELPVIMKRKIKEGGKMLHDDLLQWFSHFFGPGHSCQYYFQTWHPKMTLLTSILLSYVFKNYT